MAPGRYQLEDTISLPGCASPDYSANAKSILRMRMNTGLTTCVHGIFLEPLHTVVTIMLVGFYIGSRLSGISQTTFCTKRHYNFNIVVLYGSTLEYGTNVIVYCFQRGRRSLNKTIKRPTLKALR